MKRRTKPRSAVRFGTTSLGVTPNVKKSTLAFAEVGLAGSLPRSCRKRDFQGATKRRREDCSPRLLSEMAIRNDELLRLACRGLLTALL
jgi:hypothetical protein